MAKYTLSNNDDELDFALIGISCSEEQYTTAALLDRALSIQLVLSDYIPLTLKENKIFQFSLYQFLDEQLGLEYNFIPNLSNFEPPHEMTAGRDLFSEVEVEERTRLIKELPRTDYLLLLRGEELQHSVLLISELLRKCPELSQISPLSPRDLPSRRNLIF
jgi:hypothetical protein